MSLTTRECAEVVGIPHRRLEWYRTKARQEPDKGKAPSYTYNEHNQAVYEVAEVRSWIEQEKLAALALYEKRLTRLEEVA